MVCSADDLVGWKDFPKGLRVLLLDEDSESAAEIKSKLEEMDYIVFTFCNVNEALTAISSKSESFHVAIVEISTGDELGSFKFLETAKDLPTIMTSNMQCLSTTMKCIALGAAEFLQKPLIEDKLRNIWQHVVHKAFNAGGSAIPKSLKPIKETVVSMLQIHPQTSETEDSVYPHECDQEQPTISDKFPAPSTPQLKQGCRFLDDGDCQDQPHCSMEKERDLEEESKFVETTCNYSVAETTCNSSGAETTCTSSVAELSVMVDRSSITTDNQVKAEDSHGASKPGNNSSGQLNKDTALDSNIENDNTKKVSSGRGKGNRKKMKVDWTSELHKKFVKAVEQLGVDQAIPSRILDFMKVDGLTRHNVASHLQKYRMHRRHILPKEEDRRWQHPREPVQRVYAQKPIMAYPTYHPNHSYQTSQYYPVWGHPSGHPSGTQMWGHPSFPTWQHPDIWPWKTQPGMFVEGWGCPVRPPPQNPCSSFPQNPSGYHSFPSCEDNNNLSKSSFNFHQDEEVIDKVVKEAMSKPWLPLPLGLKPPSTESVLSELQRQGISNIPTS